MSLSGKNILVIMPKSQFCEEELFGVLDVLKPSGAKTVVLSKSGKEATGMNRRKFQPDGWIVDWDKQKGIAGKYDAVILIGGKGARKSLWDDPIVPQILTDHFRNGSLIASLGSATVVLARAGLLTHSVAAPDDEHARRELEAAGVSMVDEPWVESENILTGNGGSTAKIVGERIVELLEGKD